jgi:hypothetical protein
MVSLVRGAPSPGGNNQERYLAEARKFLKRSQLQILRLGRQKEFDLGSDNSLLVCCCHGIPHSWFLLGQKALWAILALFATDFVQIKASRSSGTTATG